MAGKEVKIKAASKALTSQLVNLIGVMDPVMMAANLISKDIIDQSILERVILPSSTKNEKACEVLTAVSGAVKVNPDYFATFCDILDNEPVTKDIAKILKEKYQQELHTAQHISSCTCNVLQKSLLDDLKKLLDALKIYNGADKKKMEQKGLREYVTCFIQAGCSSTDHLDEHLLALHEQDNLINDVSVYHWAKQLAAEKFTEIVAVPTSPIKVAPVTKSHLFSKPVVYHASICSLAVNKTDAGEYQKFFKDERFVPGHSFKEVSISRSKQNRYLIATQDDSTYYIAFQSEPNITQWPKRFTSFGHGLTWTVNSTASIRLPTEQTFIEPYRKENRACLLIPRPNDAIIIHCFKDTIRKISQHKTTEVALMLLIIAGDVETNPGPAVKLTFANLREELLELTDPLPFGKHLGISQEVLDIFEDVHPNDVNKQKITLLQYIAKHSEPCGFDWEKIADALDRSSLGDLATRLRTKYDYSSSSDEYLSAGETSPVPFYNQLVPALQKQAPMPDPAPSLQPTGALLSATLDSIKQSPPTPLRNEKALTIQQLRKNYNVTIKELNSEIEEKDFPYLAAYFDGIEYYLHLMNLTEAEKTDLQNKSSNHVAMIRCLSFWRGHNPSEATYGSLLSILLRLGKGEIACNVCQYLDKKRNGPKHEIPSLTTAVSPNVSHSSAVPILNVKATYIRFACGCNRCSILDYVFGRKCPNQNEFPFFKIGFSEEISDLTYDINMFKQSLLDQSREMHVMFADLMFDTFESLADLHYDIEKVKHYLELLFRPSWYFPQVSREAISGVLSSVQDFTSLSLFLQERYCTWYDYGLLLRLRKKFIYALTEDLKIKEYESAFEDFVYRTCFLYLNNVGETPRYQTVVICKVDIDFNKISQPQIDHLTHVFTKIIGLSKYHLLFNEVRKGCTEIVFRAPHYITELKILSAFQSRSLREHDIIAVKIGDRYLFRHDYDLISTCEKNLELLDKIKVDVTPCTLWRGLHSGQPCTVLKYEAEETNLNSNYTEYAHYILENRHENIVKADCIHTDDELSHNPIIVLRQVHLQTINEYLFSSHSALSEMEQLSLLLDITKGFASLQNNNSAYFRGTENSVFVHVEESSGKLTAQFFPLYKQSYFPFTPDYTVALPSADLVWLRTTTILLHDAEKSELPERHVLYNIFKHKWLSDDKRLHPHDVSEAAKEIEDILDRKMINQEMIDAVSQFREVAHLNMILIGHTGVGKTSIRKHLQNLLFEKNETTTILFEHELLFVQTVELLPDSNIPVFQRNDAVYNSEQNKVFLTLWDTGGQPMFQDLLPCFAKFRSIYGIVFRISDFSDESNAVTRPTCPLESKSESPYTCKEYIKRCLAFLEFFALDMNQRFTHLPNEVKNALFQNAPNDINLFPKVALIGTFKDKMMIQDNETMSKYNDFKKNLVSANFVERSLCPSYDDTVFEVDNTKSGDICGDSGIRDLREQLIIQTQYTRTKIPMKWISYKLDLENESRLQQPCTGIVTLNKANEIAKRHQVSSGAALSYFHELGIFLWYREIESLKKYVIVESRHLLSILGTLLNPKTFFNFPDEWNNLQEHGILSIDVGLLLLDEALSRTGLDREWIFCFFKEHHLIMSLSAEGYFIPSLLQVLPICPNPFHICDANCSMCTLLPQAKDMEVAPLFLVPKCKCIPPGFFPRLMTMLAGIQEGEIIWKISANTVSCKNMVSFIVGGIASLLFTEFIDCIRIYCTSVPSASISQSLCRSILHQIRAQIERLFLESRSLPIVITFACPCLKSLHFLPSVPNNLHDKIICTEHPEDVFEPCESHLKWLQKKIPSDRDAEEQLKIALKEGGLDVLVSMVIFVGSNFSDQIVMDDREFGSTSISKFFILKDNNLKWLQFEMVAAFLANNATKLKKRFPLSASDQNSSTDPPRAETLKDFLPHEHEQHSPHKAYAVNEPQQNAGDYEQFISKQIPLDPSEKHSSPASTAIDPMHIPTDQLTDNLSRIITLMQGASDDLQSLHLIHAIECKHSLVLSILPLLTPKVLSFGILDVQFTAEMLETVMDISEKWILIAPSLMSKTLNNEIDLVEHSSHRHKFVSDFSGTVLFSNQEEVLKVLGTLQSINKEQIPYSWFYLWNSVKNTLRLNNSKVITLDKVNKYITDTCGIESGQQLEDALTYLHKSGLLIYFRDILPNVIFEDVSLLVSLLISLFENIKYTGLLTDADFHDVRDVYDSVFTYDNAIKLLKGLCLLSQMSSRQFLMPCVLTTSLSPQDLSNYCKQPTDSCLLVQHPMATKVFGFLICFVTSQESSDFWPWKIHTNLNKGDPVCIFTNCAQFSLPGYECIITLFASNSCVKIYTEYTNYQPPLFLIKTAVIRGIEKACECYHYTSMESLACDVGFKCICSSTDIEHSMVQFKQSWICSFNPEKTFKLSQSQQHWFDEGISSDDDSITANSIFRNFLAQSEEWYKVGMELGLDTPTLSQVLLKYQEKPDLALMETVRQWFNKMDNPQLLIASLRHKQASVIMSTSRGCFSDVSSSSEHSPNSTPPSTPHSQDTPPTPGFRLSFPHPMSDTSSNFPNSSLTSNIPTDTSNTSSIPQSDTLGTSSLPTNDSSLVPLPSERPLILSLSQSPGSIHKPLISRTPSSISPSPNTSETEFLSQIAPRIPTIDINPIPVSTVLSKPECPQNPLIKELVDVGVNYISFGELKIIGDLGSGNYSQVHLANWSTGQSSVVKVAVKIPTAKPNTIDEVKKELQREIETMAALNHPNIVRLLGISEVQHFISYIGELPVMIMEYVEGGSLRGFLDKVKKNPALASLKLFLSFGKQMADGMKYLEEEKLVHRDLAARNVLLVKKTEQIKISDFGLARRTTNSSKDYAYYIGQNSSNGLPIFWYAPECLRNLWFTTKGDVWSYGVTLWEMFSHGELPTQILSRVIKDSSVTNAQAAFKKLADHLENPRNRLPKRINTPTEVYALMNECWNCRPSERPSFSELSVKMEKLLDLAIAKARRKAIQNF